MATPNVNLYGGTGGALVSLAADTTYTNPTRAIRAAGDGVVALAFVDSPTTKVLWPFKDGETQMIQATTIYSTANGTTCTGVSVMF